MITRPLELSSRLRPEPRSFDWFFFVNGGLLILFFTIFGSPLVLAPGLDLGFKLPTVAGAEASALAATSYIRVTDSGQIFTRDGLRTIEQLPEWLRAESKRARVPILRVIAGQEVRLTLLTEILNAARQAGFVNVTSAAVEPGAGKPAGM